jgi:hypothetical protein
MVVEYNCIFKSTLRVVPPLGGKIPSIAIV